MLMNVHAHKLIIYLRQGTCSDSVKLYSLNANIFISKKEKRQKKVM